MNDGRDFNAWNGRLAFLLGTALAATGAFAGYTVPDEPGQETEWTYRGAYGNLTSPDFFSDGYWLNSSAPDLTQPSATNLTVKLTGAPNDAERLRGTAAGDYDYNTRRYYGAQFLYHPFTDATNCGLYLGALEGADGNPGGQWMRWDHWTTTWGYPLVIVAPSKFLGVFDTPDRDRGAYSCLYLPDTPGHLTTVNRACASGSLGFRVETGNRAVVKEVFGPGLVPVNFDRNPGEGFVYTSASKGTLEIENHPGPYTDVRVYDGRLVLHGHADTPPAIAGVPAFHLDASASNSLVTAEGGDGRVYVNEWHDVDGRTRSANALSGGNRPFLVTDPVSGKAAVDFGSAGDDANETYGPTGALKLNQTISAAREVHVVFRDHYRAVNMPQLFGNGLGEWSRDWLRHKWGTLFDGDEFCSTPALMGHALFDGQTVQVNLRNETTLNAHVAASALNDHACNIMYIGTANESKTYFMGGALISEILVYTNELTLAEREATHRYLMNKWRPDLKQQDFGVVSLENGNASLEVADGTLSIAELRLPANTKTFVKKGAGVLEVGKISPVGVKFEVEGGGVSFAPHVAKCASIPTAPAAEPLLWFDATRWQTDIDVGEDVGDGKTHVALWHDRRGRGFRNLYGNVYTMKSAAIGTTAFGQPTIEASVAAANGLAMVDCGDYDGTGAGTSWLSFFRDGTEEQSRVPDASADTTDYRQREMYVVFLQTHIGSRPIAGHTSDTIVKSSTDNNGIIMRAYSHTRLLAGNWTQDGKWVDTDACPRAVDQVYVVSFRATKPMPVNAFFRDRAYTSGCGGGKIGEVISYDRALTAQERHDTELYLLNKWKGLTVHPEDELIVDGKLSMAGDSVKIGAGAGVTVDAGSVAATDITKVGGGTVKAAVDFETVKTLRAEGGTLQVDAPVIFNGTADFHCDATDLSSMTYTVDGNGATNVSAWAGATALTTWQSKTPRSPQLVTDDGGVGKAMPYMDFGLRGSSDVSNSATMDIPYNEPIREIHVVSRDRPGGEGYTGVLGTKTEYDVGGLKGYPFLRNQNSAEILSAEWLFPALWRGYICADGATRSPNYILNANTHVLSFQPTDVISNRLAFARRTTYYMGGIRIGECAFFAQTNTVARRTLIENYLSNKWLGTEKPLSYSWGLDEISCANGGTVAFDDGVTMVQTKAVGGDGTIALPDGGGVGGVETMAFTFRGHDDYDALHVDGDFAVRASGTATVTVDVPEQTKGADLVDEYVLFSAKTYSGFASFANWQVNLSGNLPNNAKMRARFVSGRGLVFSVDRAGIVLIFR